MNQNQPTAFAQLEADLWEAADQLRLVENFLLFDTSKRGGTRKVVARAVSRTP
jgi:hypothetical protein